MIKHTKYNTDVFLSLLLFYNAVDSIICIVIVVFFDDKRGVVIKT